MIDEEWIAMRNWQKFQYYTQRRPMWVVNHTELLHDDNYLDLTEHQALLLHRLWLTYASARAQLRLTTASLSRHTGLRVMRRDIDALVDAGFIEILHAPRMQDAAPRARGEEDRREEGIDQRPASLEPELEYAAELESFAEILSRQAGHDENIEEEPWT